MKRLNPVGSLLGFLLTIMMFIGLGISLWYNRGLAFNPGPVTALTKSGVKIQGFASHAEFEKQCSYCHEPLKSSLADKCILCHLDIEQQIKVDQGVHSHISSVYQCDSCHPEHRGRTFDPTKAAYQLFDHSATGFSLNWHQENYDATPMQCTECHVNAEFSVVENQTCSDCHGNHDNQFVQAHLQNFSLNCLGCHDGMDRMQDFEHSQTGYPLEAKHAQIKCKDCHTTDNLQGTTSECVGCHAEPAMHKGLFEQTCDTCHSPTGWSPANLNDKSFSHLETTGFSLVLHPVDYSNQTITCTSCHPADLQTLDIQTCIDCHNNNDQVFMTDHLQQFGSDCMVCHDGVDRLSNFDHANFFPLDGKHESIQCADCHIDNVFRGTPTECWQCHEEPEIHAGVFGLKCSYCHGTEAWSPANLQHHSFPINHGLEEQNLQLQCDTCHGANYIDYTCYQCHEHQPDEILKKHLEEGITEEQLPACVDCHPAGSVVEGDENP